MQNNIIKQDILDNSVDSFVIINPTKQQIGFFPKEESQMFTSKDLSFTGVRPNQNVNDPSTETENTDTRAFVQRAKDETNGSPLDYSVYGSVPSGATAQSGAYKYKLQNINSSHTETDYIGAVTFDIPAIIDENFAIFTLYNLTQDSTSPLYATTDTIAKLKRLITGMQGIRIPQNILNTILTDETAIIANNNSNIIKNFGLYYIIITPQYVQTTVTNIINRKHYDWLNMINNGTMSYDSTADLFSIIPESQRRNVYECSKTDFENTIWDFENSGLQSGRLYGSVVEVWDSSLTTLKQVKTMAENEFNFTNNTAQTHFALYPDNVGYDTPDQQIVAGDILKIYPRETYFNQIIIELNYKNAALQIENLLAFMLNDAVRDIKTGVYEIYDSNGFVIDTAGNFNGTVINRYQLFATDRFEARKVLKG